MVMVLGASLTRGSLAGTARLCLAESPGGKRFGDVGPLGPELRLRGVAVVVLIGAGLPLILLRLVLVGDEGGELLAEANLSPAFGVEAADSW